MSPAGTWDLTIATPIGRITAVVELREDSGGWRGTAGGSGEEVPLRDIALDGDRLTWRQSITRPVRLDLAFDVDVDGDTMTGASRAGRLPATKVAGRRRAPSGAR
ncbi:hypothetical protein [Allostreptomyces psammosilenae]|uniref:Uncharacterized protein n=1 Tax=Allostreptomyces psammosilenae TaxID=1892865 RepID=A0A852ZZV4_9ACTN|nr:hypothetical protein [Allostreptomyces psammosilenae]NYI03802.1 hypothetical protein [Allostreptomyces psammosilenae]